MWRGNLDAPQKEAPVDKHQCACVRSTSRRGGSRGRAKRLPCKPTRSAWQDWPLKLKSTTNLSDQASYPTVEACKSSAGVRRLKQDMGIRHDVLDRSPATKIEPALDLYPDEIGGWAIAK